MSNRSPKLALSGRTRKIGCLSANFSTPFLMMLQLNVMMPAYLALSICDASQTLTRSSLTISIAPQNDIFATRTRDSWSAETSSGDKACAYPYLALEIC